MNHPITPALLADPEIFQQNRLPFHAHFADQTSPELPLTVSPVSYTHLDVYKRQVLFVLVLIVTIIQFRGSKGDN